MLTIENQGGRAEHVSAELVFIPGEAAPSLHETRFISGIYEIPVSKGAKQTAIVASIGGSSGDRSVKWRFNLKDRGLEVELSSDTFPVRHPSVTAIIKVTCDPVNQKGLIEWQVTFQGKKFEAKQLAPLPANPPETTASLDQG